MPVIRFLHSKVWVHMPTLDEIERKDLVMASWLWPLVLLVVAGVRLWARYRGGEPPVNVEFWTLAAFAVLLGISLVTPGIQAHVFLWVLRFFGVIGYVVSNTLILIGFYLCVTPFAVILRLTGKDLLDWRKSGKKPVWRKHRRVPERQAYFKQF